MAHRKCVDLALQQAAQRRVVTGQGTIQPFRGEHQGILLGVKGQRSLEETAKRSDVVRLAVGKPDLQRLPPGAAQGCQDVELEGQSAIADLVGGHALRLMDLVAQGGHVVVHLQGDTGASGMQVEIVHQAVQGRFDVGRVLHQQAQQAQVMQAAVLADQQAKMQASGARHTGVDQLAAGKVGDQVVRIVEQRRVNPDLGQQRARCRHPGCAEPSESPGHRRCGPARLRPVFPCLSNHVAECLKLCC